MAHPAVEAGRTVGCGSVVGVAVGACVTVAALESHAVSMKATVKATMAHKRT
jgi:hypothetical protein